MEDSIPTKVIFLQEVLDIGNSMLASLMNLTPEAMNEGSDVGRVDRFYNYIKGLSDIGVPHSHILSMISESDPDDDSSPSMLYYLVGHSLEDKLKEALKTASKFESQYNYIKGQVDQLKEALTGASNFLYELHLAEGRDFKELQFASRSVNEKAIKAIKETL